MLTPWIHHVQHGFVLADKPAEALDKLDGSDKVADLDGYDRTGEHPHERLPDPNVESLLANLLVEPQNLVKVHHQHEELEQQTS